MNVAKNTVVTVNYRLSDEQGNVLEEGTEPMVYLHGHGNTLPKIEEALEGQAVGYETTVRVEPEEGFGHYDEELVRVEARDRLPSPLEVGMQLEARHQGDEGEEVHLLTVTQIDGERVVLDANHQLAGMTLDFALTVADVRPATEEEIAHGHVHHAGGHAH